MISHCEWTFCCSLYSFEVKPHIERMLSLCNSDEFGTPLTSRSHKGVFITPGICLKNLIRFKNTTAEKDRNYINSMGSASCFKLHFEITWFWVLNLPQEPEVSSVNRDIIDNIYQPEPLLNITPTIGLLWHNLSCK